MRVIHRFARWWCTDTVLMRAAVSRIRIVVTVSSFAVIVLIAVAVVPARRVLAFRLAVILVIGQLTGLVTFARPEE